MCVTRLPAHLDLKILIRFTKTTDYEALRYRIFNNSPILSPSSAVYMALHLPRQQAHNLSMPQEEHIFHAFTDLLYFVLSIFHRHVAMCAAQSPQISFSSKVNLVLSINSCSCLTKLGYLNHIT
jgi:hypothetical protein